MTELTQSRLALLLAIFGAVIVMAHTWNDLRENRFSRVNLPKFERSAPNVPEWPVHQYLPIG
jgi:hypothetical protein